MAGTGGAGGYGWNGYNFKVEMGGKGEGWTGEMARGSWAAVCEECELICTHAHTIRAHRHSHTQQVNRCAHTKHVHMHAHTMYKHTTTSTMTLPLGIKV